MVGVHASRLSTDLHQKKKYDALGQDRLVSFPRSVEHLARNNAKLGPLEGNPPWNGGFLVDFLLVSGSSPGFLVKKRQDFCCARK